MTICTLHGREVTSLMLGSHSKKTGKITQQETHRLESCTNKSVLISGYKPLSDFELHGKAKCGVRLYGTKTSELKNYTVKLIDNYIYI